MLEKVDGANAIISKAGHLLIAFTEDKKAVVPNSVTKQIFTNGIQVPNNLRQTYSSKKVVKLEDPDFEKAVFQIYAKNLNPDEFELRKLTDREIQEFEFSV